jgi:hypothetical protein
MSEPATEADAPSSADRYSHLAFQLFAGLAARAYADVGAAERKRPDPKALAAFSFRLAEAFLEAEKHTERAKASAAVAAKASVRMKDVDLSALFQSIGKP